MLIHPCVCSSLTSTEAVHQNFQLDMALCREREGKTTILVLRMLNRSMSYSTLACEVLNVADPEGK